MAACLAAATALAQQEETIDFEALLRSPEDLAKLEVRHSISWWAGPLERYEVLFRGDGTATIKTWSRGRRSRTLLPKCSGRLADEDVEQIVARFATWKLAQLQDNIVPGRIWMGVPDGDMHDLRVTSGESTIKKSFWSEGRDKPRKPADPALIELSRYIWDVARKVNYQCRLVSNGGSQ